MAQCAGEAVWMAPTADGSMNGVGSLAGYVNVNALTSGTMSSGRPLYRVAAANWKSLNYSSLQVWRAYSLPNGNFTRFQLSQPLDSGIFHVRVDNIRGDFPNNETQSVRGFLNGVPVPATFADAVNGATRSGNNILGGSSTTSTTQSSMRVFFHGPVDEVIIEQESLSDWIIAELLIQCNTVLSEDWLRWDVRRQGSAVLLNWSAQPEPSSLTGYRAERSSDGSNFAAVGSVPKQGIREYILQDAPAPNGSYFYRLATVYQQGPDLYSDIIRVDFSSKAELKIYPNPASSLLRVQSGRKNTSFMLFDASGKEAGRWFSSWGNLSIEIGHLARGHYFLRADWDGGSVTERVLIN